MRSERIMNGGRWRCVAAALLIAPGCATIAAGAAAPARPVENAVAAAPDRAGDDAPQPSAELSALLADVIKAADVPGMVGGIVEGDGTLLIGCAGVRQRGEAPAITIHDRMHIGSCTKSMTATMIATLVQEGALSWDTKVTDVFTDLARIPDRVHPKWRGVTLRMLLSNRSGAIGDLTKDELWRKLWTHQGSPSSARLLLAETLLSREPEAAPDERYIYSNAGFAIAGAMAEKVTGLSWEELLLERLFEPLEMDSAGFGAPGSAKSIDQPRGHKADGTPREPGPNADNPPAIGPAGTVHCSVIDWSKYIATHLRGGHGETDILKAEAFRELHKPAKRRDGEQSPEYAMGWGVGRRAWAGDGERGGVVLTHNGSNTMWFAVTWLAPERDFAVLIACNQGGDKAEQACDKAASALIQHYQQRQLRWP